MDAIDPSRIDKRKAKEKTVIRLGFTKAAGHKLHGKYHTFVIAVDPKTGEQYITRGGPTMTLLGIGSSGGAGSASAASDSGGDQTLSGSGFGPILAQHGIWSEKLRFDRPSQTVYIQNVGSVNLSFNTVVKNMVAFSSKINSQSIGYWPTGPNSNSYAFSYLEHLGLNRPTPQLSAPGWDDKL